jgi:hypothetical protein
MKEEVCDELERLGGFPNLFFVAQQHLKRNVIREFKPP